MIFVVGTRGKSTVARLLDTIARDSGLRTALRTDSGVEIEGKRQLGDIHPLIDALEELDSGELDLAIIEMHWDDLQSLPLGGRQPGAVVVSTICRTRNTANWSRPGAKLPDSRRCCSRHRHRH